MKLLVSFFSVKTDLQVASAVELGIYGTGHIPAMQWGVGQKAWCFDVVWHW